MMIGELINRFDNETQGTVKEFNELFPFAKLKSGEYVEIFEPILGKEMFRVIEVDGEERVHSFIKTDHRPKRVIKKNPNKKLPPPRKLFLYEAKKGNEVKQFYSLKKLGVFLNRSRTAMWDRFNRGGSKIVNGWTISQTKLEKK